MLISKTCSSIEKKTFFSKISIKKFLSSKNVKKFSKSRKNLPKPKSRTHSFLYRKMQIFSNINLIEFFIYERTINKNDKINNTKLITKYSFSIIEQILTTQKIIISPLITI